jgi:hypothetical protein
MAVVNTKPTTITNRDASPAVINDGRLERAAMISAVGSVAVGAADSVTSFYPLVALPSSAMVRAVYLTCPAGMTSLAGDIGVFKNTANSGGVTTGVVANTGSGTIFAAATTLASAADRKDATNLNSNAYPTDKREQPLWQAIGLAADPNTTFDIGVKVTPRTPAPPAASGSRSSTSTPAADPLRRCPPLGRPGHTAAHFF